MNIHKETISTFTGRCC